uniref:OSJNBa0079F16.8 protein n=1 Tax=Oryza sativa subsp. japonica TaxID=39947 RepID=Q7XX03_ORYSJ|nr:OSJNBa0079F16.8 [Oryza sativa Japonica Group]
MTTASVVVAGVVVGGVGGGRRASGGRGSSEEGRGSNGRPVAFRQLIEEKLCASLGERREQDLQRQEGLEVVEFVVEAADEGEDERPILDRFTDVGEVVGEDLESPAVVADGEVTLLQMMELGGEVDGAPLAVAEELQLEVAPDGACRRRGKEHLLHKSRGDGAVEPAEDDAVHLCPVGVIGARYVGEDMIGEGVFSKRDEEKASPAGVVFGVEVEGDGDERLHVEDGDGFAVEVGNGFGVKRRRWRGGVLRGGGRRRGDAETGEKRQDLGGKLRRGSRSGSRWRRDGGRRRRGRRRNRWRHRGGVVGRRPRITGARAARATVAARSVASPATAVQMVNTCASGSGNNNNDENPTLAQVLAQQTQLMNIMMQQMQNQLNQGNDNPPTPQNNTTNPVEVGDWLYTIEKRLELLQCTDQEKVVFASHQLHRPASEWWDHFRMNRAEGQPITWEEFTEGFKKTHIPTGVVALKKREFRTLKQKDRTVTEYLHEFNRLARYVPEDVRTDKERQEKFLEGLKDELSITLISHDYADFQELVDKAI